MKSVLFITAFLMFIPLVNANTIHVPKDYPTIQDAVNAASTGDTVLVSPGVYVENIVVPRSIMLISEAGAKSTVIDGNNGKNGVFFTSGASGSPSVLDGFTITNCSSGATAGGTALYCNGDDLMIRNNIIRDNHFTNFMDQGGGIIVRGYNLEIYNNIIRDNYTSGWGGGVYVEGGGANKIWNNVIIGNYASNGGGMAINNWADCSIANNLIFGNTATSGGGFSIVSNSKAVIANTIFWNNSAPTGKEIHVNGMFGIVNLTISYSDVQGAKSSVKTSGYHKFTWGAGMINADPLFADQANNDFHLTHPSPCKDAGDNAAILGLYDYENDPRIAQGTVDMGVDEFYTHLHHTGDATPGGAVSLKFIDAPTTNPVMLWLGSGVLNTPLHLPPYGVWHLQFPILLQAHLGSIPGPGGVLSLTFNIPSSIPNPIDFPLQAGIGNRLTNLEVIRIR